jgi:hypothetical protein
VVICFKQSKSTIRTKLYILGSSCLIKVDIAVNLDKAKVVRDVTNVNLSVLSPNKG